MNAIKSLAVAAALAGTGAASATTIDSFYVSSTVSSPAIFNTYDEEGNPTSINLAVTNNGYGTATISDSGVLTLNMHTDQLIDFSPLLALGYRPLAPSAEGIMYSHMLIDSTTVLKLAGNNYNFNIDKAGSSFTTTSCTNSPDDSLYSCSVLILNNPQNLFGTTAYYSSQHFPLHSYHDTFGEGGGYTYDSFNIKSMIIAGAQVTTTYNLLLCMDCAQPPLIQFPAAVPLPASAWLFGTGLIGLVSTARRRLM